MLLLFEKIYDADAIMNEHTSKINKAIRISKPSLKTIFVEPLIKIQLYFLLLYDFVSLRLSQRLSPFNLI